MLYTDVKLSKLDLPVFVINWTFIFCSQQCKINVCLFNPACIGLGIVHGSGIGPMLYTVMNNYLHTLS